MPIVMQTGQLLDGAADDPAVDAVNQAKAFSRGHEAPRQDDLAVIADHAYQHFVIVNGPAVRGNDWLVNQLKLVVLQHFAYL